MKRKVFIALPAALLLMAGSALWVRAAEGETGIPPCADILSGVAEYGPPAYSVPQTPGAGWITPGRFFFVETLAAPTCPDVQYGLVVLAENPGSGAPTVLSSQVVPGDGVSREINFDLQVTSAPEQEVVCVYLYTMGTSETSSTTPSNGNPHSQTISGSGAEIFDRAPDNEGPDSPYCHGEGTGTGQRGYN